MKSKNELQIKKQQLCLVIKKFHTHFRLLFASNFHLID